MKKKEKIDNYFRDNSYENYLTRIINCKDDDSCWCDSGIKFKDCHKQYRGKKVNIGKINFLMSQIKKKKMCLHPDKNSCSGKIIDAHSIQNSRSLESISENGFIYRFELGKKELDDWMQYQTLMPKKIGKSITSTFKGFCSYHDRELFKEIDAKPIIPTKEQSVLLSIRSLAKEIYTKTSVLDIKNLSKEFQTSDSPGLLAMSHDILKLSHDGNKLGMEDLWNEYINYFLIYNNKDFSKINRLIIKIRNVPEILCSTCFAPEFDINGNILQDLLINDPLEYLTFEIFTDNNHGIIHLCWYDNFEYCKRFADSIKNCTDIPNTIVKLALGISENHAFRISWFDSLSILKKKGLMNLMMANIPSFPEMKINTNYIFNDNKQYVNWTVEEIVNDY